MKSFEVYDTKAQEVYSALHVLEKQPELPADISERVLKLCATPLDSTKTVKPFTPDRLDELNGIVSKMLTRVLDDKNELLSTASLRDISSLTGAVTSLLRLFDSSQKNIDTAKEIGELFSAVMDAISCLTPVQQKPFWHSLEKDGDFVRGENHA